MLTTRIRLRSAVSVVLTAIWSFSCSAAGDANPGNNASGGAVSGGGASAGSSAAGASSTGGQQSSGGMSGGSSAGGSNHAGGNGVGGSGPHGGGSGGDGAGGDGAGGDGLGGDGSGGDTAGGQGSGGDAAGGQGSGGDAAGECVIGQTKGTEVAVIGESFIAATHELTRRIEMRAREQGSLGENESYIDNSVSGTTLADNQIPSQYDQAVQESPDTIRYVLMDGGGNDCIRGDADVAYNAAVKLFDNMAQQGTEKVVYFFYPDPVGANWASLQSCLDGLRPRMKELCDGLAAPKCHWLDQRVAWDGHPEYTNDGIHPTTAGSNASGDAIWEVMVEYCVAQ